MQYPSDARVWLLVSYIYTLESVRNIEERMYHDRKIDLEQQTSFFRWLVPRIP